MTSTNLLPCDGCGQPASPEHLARRLQRLEWTTRYRPVHIHTLLLCGVAAAENAAFLYSEGAHLEGEAAHLLEALQISREGKSPEEVLSEFQKRGLFLVHALECPLELPDPSSAEKQAHLEKQLPLVIARVRRSLKPRRVALISTDLQPLLGKLTETVLGCPVLLHQGKPFEIMGQGGLPDAPVFRMAVEGAKTFAV